MNYTGPSRQGGKDESCSTVNKLAPVKRAAAADAAIAGETKHSASPTKKPRESPPGLPLPHNNPPLSPNSAVHREGDSDKKKLFSFFFVKVGSDTSHHILEQSKKSAQQRGATVLDKFDRAHPPTHFVISNDMSVDVTRLAKALNFDNGGDLREFVRQHQIVCVRRSWVIARSSKPFDQTPPKPSQLFAQWPIHVIVKRGSQQRRLSSQQSTHVLHNQGVSRLLAHVANLYRKAPLNKEEKWKSYSFTLASGRVRYLGYELDTETITNLRQIKGVGDSIYALVKEYLELVEQYGEEDDKSHEAALHKTTRVREIEGNLQRQKLRKMMSIWGVGSAKGMELINEKGCETVADVRQKWEMGQVELTRHQCIGLLCHAELQEKMDEAEVRSIASVIEDHLKTSYGPETEIVISGSFSRRRGGEYGDIDILIFHPGHQEQLPASLLEDLVTGLRVKGIIAHHLTQPHGMGKEEFNRGLDDLVPDDSICAMVLAGREETKHVESSSTTAMKSLTYMGIVYNSSKRKRRIDIKWYPYRAASFAKIHFIGNGFFNRSIRLWAKRKCGWHLNDKGLFTSKEEKVRVKGEFNTQKGVFDKLGLVYKEPHERDCFDAVQSLKGDHMFQESDLSSRENLRDPEYLTELKYKWIE